ncbi:hypothetical protein DIPPA_19466 [Diplonema papillatum]|nr:hypothetical protein DIPPA_19466 [Diplonema papillatum]
MFSQWASRNVKNFLDNAEELLCTPDEKESQGIVRPVLDLCKTLKKDYPAHQLITGHIADFDVRMEVINDHYRHLKKTILSPLTLLCQKLNAFDTGYHRKDEYEQRIRDIHDWVEIRDANSSSWKTVHEKLSEVRQALELELEVDSFAG